MNAPTQLRAFGQSVWLDDLSRDLLSSGTLARYVTDFAVTGVTSNPAIFDKAIGDGAAYDRSILARPSAEPVDSVFFELALEDLRTAADLLGPVHAQSDGVDGWVSIEVSPLLADDAGATVRQVKELHARGDRANLFVKIPGTRAGNRAIEECIFEGVPINVTLLFSCAQYLASAEAYLRGIERRVAAGLSPAVPSVASVFVSRWDRAIADRVPPSLRNRLGIAVARQTYGAYRDLLASPRWLRLANFGARPQRLLWASTGTKDPSASDTLYIDALAAPFTINTIPAKTLEAFADHGAVGEPMPADGGDADQVLARFGDASVDTERLAAQLQAEGTEAFSTSWHEALTRVESKRERLRAS